MSRTQTIVLAIIFGAMLFHPSSLIEQASAQLVGDCSITTTPSTVTIDVSPGSPAIGVTTVAVDNPTPHTEIIRIDVQTGGLAYAVPGTLTLGPYASTDFQLSVKANSRESYSSINAMISCTVETIDGAPNPNPVSKNTAFIISIRQFAFMRVQAENRLHADLYHLQRRQLRG